MKYVKISIICILGAICIAGVPVAWPHMTDINPNTKNLSCIEAIVFFPGVATICIISLALFFGLMWCIGSFFEWLFKF